MPAPVLTGAVYVWAGYNAKIHVANERAHKTNCGRTFSNTLAEARDHAIDPTTVRLERVCRHCAEHWGSLLEAMGLIKDGVYQR